MTSREEVIHIRNLSVVASHDVAGGAQEDRVDAALFRGPIDDHFEVGMGRQ